MCPVRTAKGWRRERDSNPRYALRAYNGLANRRLQPLGHSSVAPDMPDAARLGKQGGCVGSPSTGNAGSGANERANGGKIRRYQIPGAILPALPTQRTCFADRRRHSVSNSDPRLLPHSGCDVGPHVRPELYVVFCFREPSCSATRASRQHRYTTCSEPQGTAQGRQYGESGGCEHRCCRAPQIVFRARLTWRLHHRSRSAGRW